MGYTGAQGFAELVEAGEVSLEASLEWHLVANHYPPLPVTLVPICVQAIEAANEEDWDREIVIRHNTTAKVSDLVEALHLEAFL